MTRETLSGEDAQVARALVLGMVTEGAETYGDVLDRLDAAGAAGRRQILDRARESAGLLPTERAEQAMAYEDANRNLAPISGPLRDAQGRCQALCSHEGCSTFESGELPGQIAWVEATRWWCNEHRHLAAPGDSEPYRPGSRLAYSTSGAIINLDEQEAEAHRQRTAAESRRRQHEARQAERKVETAALERRGQAAREQLQRELPEGIRAP